MDRLFFLKKKVTGKENEHGLLPWLCNLVPDIKNKNLNACLYFKFDPGNSNSFKSMKAFLLSYHHKYIIFQ